MEDKDNATVSFDAASLLKKGEDDHGAAQLVVVEGDNPGQKLVLRLPRTRIGRQHTSDLVLDSHTVSRDHAHLLREGDRYYIVDANSSNGVYLNGQKIPPLQKHPLSHGDSLLLGQVLLLFQHPQRFVNIQGLSNIRINRDKVKQEVDDFFKQFPELQRQDDSSG